MNWQKQKNFWKRKNLYIVPFWIFGRQRAWGATIIAMLPPQQVLELKWAWYQYTSSIFWREDLYQHTHTHTHSHTIHTCCYCTYANIQKCWHPKSLKTTTIGVSKNIGLSIVQRRWRKVLVVFVSNFKSLRGIILLKLSHQWIGWLLSLKQSYKGHRLTFGTFAMPCPIIHIHQVTLRYAEN